MAYFIYENWQAGPHKAVIHHGACGFCKDGAGLTGGYDPSHGEWHGPFRSLAEARRVQESMKVTVRKEHRCVAE